MKKVGLIFSSIAVLLFTTSFISAASFSIGSFFDQIGAENLVLITLFLIFLAFINFALTKSIMKDNRNVAGVISLCVSLLIVYGLYATSFDVLGLMSGFGVSNDLIITWVPIIFLIAIIFFTVKFHISKVMTFVGALFIILSQTSLVYETTFFLLVGLALFIIGAIWWYKRKHPSVKKNLNPNNSSTPSTNNPTPRTDIVEKEAKYFKNWALGTKNPKFYGSWANFIAWMKQRGYGSSESDICNRLAISQNDFVIIFNRYGKV